MRLNLILSGRVFPFLELHTLCLIKRFWKILLEPLFSCSIQSAMEELSEHLFAIKKPVGITPQAYNIEKVLIALKVCTMLKLLLFISILFLISQIGVISPEIICKYMFLSFNIKTSFLKR